LALARRKAETVAAQIPATERTTLVIGCDSVLEFAGQTFGKPRDAAQATQRWMQMRGRSGQLHTGHCLVCVPAGFDESSHVGSQRVGSQHVVSQLATTTIHFAAASDDEITRYIATGEPLRVAGGFTIDGQGGWLVERIEGDHTNVIGLSLPTVRTLLKDLGVIVPFG
jgi:septum formation protein